MFMERFEIVIGDRKIAGIELINADAKFSKKVADRLFERKKLLNELLPEYENQVDILHCCSCDEDCDEGYNDDFYDEFDEDDEGDYDGCPYDDCEDCTFYCDEGLNRLLAGIEVKLEMIKALTSSVTDSVNEFARHYDPALFEDGELATRFYAIPGEVEETVDDFVSQMELSLSELKESAEDYSAE